MKPAMLIIDVLQDLFRDGRLKKHRKALVKSINELIDIGREKDLPVIWFRQEFKEDLSDAFLALRKTGTKLTIENTDGCKLLPELNKKENDYEIVKKRYSGFFNTQLDDLLDKLKIDILIIAGVCTHACIRMTAIDAYQRDYEVLLATDCTDSYEKEHHEVSLRYMKARMIVELLSNEEIKNILDKTDLN